MISACGQRDPSALLGLSLLKARVDLSLPNADREGASDD
jgi:hypothetical protein